MSNLRQNVGFGVVNADLRTVYTTARERGVRSQSVDDAPPPVRNPRTVVIKTNQVIPRTHQVAVILYYTWLLRRQARTQRRYRAMKQQSLQRRRAFLVKMRQRNRLFFFSLIFTQLLRSMRAERRIWRLPRSAHWWNSTVLETFREEQWLEHFRMTREAFFQLCSCLRPYMERASTRLRIAIPLEQRMGIAVFRLASGLGLRAVGNLFGASKASVCLIFRDFTKAVVENLLPEFLHFPQGERLQKVVTGFEQKWGFPQCAGVVGGTHIPVTPSAAVKGDYVNERGWCSIHAQCVVDHQLLFTDVFVGWPGRLQEANAFRNSTLYMTATGRAPFSPDPPRLIQGVPVPLLLVGDASFPLKDWLMTPFPASGRGESRWQRSSFNCQLSRARVGVEVALGRLKGRWRVLLRTGECGIHSVPDVVLACCVLHNLCEAWGQRFRAHWVDQVWEEEKTLQREQPHRQKYRGPEEDNAQTIRNALAAFLDKDSAVQSTL